MTGTAEPSAQARMERARTPGTCSRLGGPVARARAANGRVRSSPTTYELAQVSSPPMSTVSATWTVI